jgi:hypothetical protein
MRRACAARSRTALGRHMGPHESSRPQAVQGRALEGSRRENRSGKRSQGETKATKSFARSILPALDPSLETAEISPVISRAGLAATLLAM